MRLGPDELRVHQLELGEALELFEAHRHQLPRLPVRGYPDLPRQLVAVAIPAVVQLTAAGQSLGDVAIRGDARGAHRQRVGGDGRSADAASHRRERPGDAVRHAARLRRWLWLWLWLWLRLRLWLWLRLRLRRWLRLRHSAKVTCQVAAAFVCLSRSKICGKSL